MEKNENTLDDANKAFLMMELIREDSDVKKHGYTIRYATMEQAILRQNNYDIGESCRIKQRIESQEFFENMPLFSVEISNPTFEIVIMMREKDTVIISTIGDHHPTEKKEPKDGWRKILAFLFLHMKKGVLGQKYTWNKFFLLHTELGK